MSGRGASAAVLAEWAKSANAPAHLCEARLDAGDGGSIYMTDSYRAVSYNNGTGSHTYAAGGHMLGFAGLNESAELRVREVQVSLSGVDQTWIATVLSKQYFKRPLLIHQMFWDQSTETLMVSPVLIHNGLMEEPRIDDDPVSGKCVVTIVSRDQFGDFQRLAGRHTNSFDQKIWFPADPSFDLFAQLAVSQRQFHWGTPNPSLPAPAVTLDGGGYEPNSGNFT